MNQDTLSDKILTRKKEKKKTQPSTIYQGKISGKIEFRDCTFCYPSRPEAVVLQVPSPVVDDVEGCG